MMTTTVRPLHKPVNSKDIPVTDAVGRPRQISVYRRSNCVVLRPPPGEAAVMNPAEARALADDLYGCADAVESRPTGRVLRFPG